MNTQSFQGGATQLSSQFDLNHDFSDFNTQPPPYGDYPQFSNFSQVSLEAVAEISPSEVYGTGPYATPSCVQSGRTVAAVKVPSHRRLD